MYDDMPTYPEWLEAKLPYFPLGTLWAYGDDVVEILDHERDNYLELTGHCRCRVVRTGQICYPDYQELDDVSPLRALAGAAE